MVGLVFALQEAGGEEGRAQAGTRVVAAGDGTPSGGASDLGPEISCEHLGARRMRVRDLGGPAAGGDPKQNANCTFANRFSSDHGFYHK